MEPTAGSVTLLPAVKRSDLDQVAAGVVQDGDGLTDLNEIRNRRRGVFCCSYPY